jgi:hypothetical protein
MSESKTSAIAVVTMTVSVELSQPWPGEATLAEVQKRARRDAEERLGVVATELAKQDIRIGQIRSIRIVLNEEKLP